MSSQRNLGDGASPIFVALTSAGSRDGCFASTSWNTALGANWTISGAWRLASNRVCDLGWRRWARAPRGAQWQIDDGQPSGPAASRQRRESAIPEGCWWRSVDRGSDPCVTRGTRRGRTRLGPRPLAPYPRSQSGSPQKAISSKLISDSDSGRACAQALEILDIPDLPMVMYSNPSSLAGISCDDEWVIGRRRHGRGVR